MKLKLEAFQEKAAADLLSYMRMALGLRAKGTSSAIVLSAPTGSGKTVIATDVIEKTLYGAAQLAPDPKAVFLWITDQPELNLQTQAKMLFASTKLTAARLPIITTTFDQEKLLPGNVYFINTQKLGEGNLLVRGGDLQPYTFWQTVANTIADPDINLFGVIDEAHRGMVEDKKERDLAESIVQKFIKGFAPMPPLPIAIGISATAARFHEVIRGTRFSMPVDVPADDVRASGLIKDLIIALCTNEGQPADMTMLRQATKAWRTYVTDWASYTYGPGEAIVRPILLVQVEDGNDRSISGTNLDRVVQAVREEAGVDLPQDAFAHAFDIEADIPAGKTTVLRHIRPSEIEGDPDVQVVLFKTSLNVGWDCPRAETMMSFRRANDPTNIAQLVGRMVRTPLARRIKENDHLNSVALYLPHYNRTEVSGIVKYLTESGEAAAGSRIETEEPVTLSRATGTDAIFAALENIPSYVVPRSRKTTQVRRLVRLARQLAMDGIDPDAEEREKQGLVAILLVERERVKDDTEFREVAAANGKLVMQRVEWQVYESAIEEGADVTVDVSRENVDDLFAAAGRKLGEGLHVAYLRHRARRDKIAATTGKLEVTALAWRQEVGQKLETHARSRVSALLASHATAIKTTPEASQIEYDVIRGLSDEPEKTLLSLPNKIDVPPKPTKYAKHIYTDEADEAPLHLGTWELATLEEEQRRNTYLGFLRNFDRKDWSFVVPYKKAGDPKPIYPDFLFFRQGREGKVIVDLIDPHNVGLEDSVDKAHGLALYAREHGGDFGRIELVIFNNDTLCRLDFQDEITRQKVLQATTSAHLKALFLA